MIRVGIDAGNLRMGGGITHLTELLQVAEPQKYNISEVTVWGGRQILDQLPTRPWLNLVREPQLEATLAARVMWQRSRLPVLAQQSANVLFAPGGSLASGFRPSVILSRNMIPFDPETANLYGWSKVGIRLAVLGLVQRASLRNADGVIFLTDTARDLVERQVGQLPQTAVIPHGVSNAFARPVAPQRPLSAFSAQRPFRWLYVSIVDLYKHQWHVVNAVGVLRREGLPVALDLVGPAYAPALKKLEQAIAQTDPDGSFIRYHGPAPYAELTRHYHSADGFVFASSCENLPNILLEAMRSGLPVTCSDRSVMPDIARDAALYFDPEDAVSIANAMREMMNNQELREESVQRGQNLAASHTWERCADDTFAFLAQVAQRATFRRVRRMVG